MWADDVICETGASQLSQDVTLVEWCTGVVEQDSSSMLQNKRDHYCPTIRGGGGLKLEQKYCCVASSYETSCSNSALCLHASSPPPSVSSLEQPPLPAVLTVISLQNQTFLQFLIKHSVK